MSNYTNITNQVEEVVGKGRVNRTAESIRNRFQDFLSKVQERDMKRIVEREGVEGYLGFVEREGVEGYLVFQNGEFTVLKGDPKQGRTVKQQMEKDQRNIDRQIKRVVPSQCAELNNVLSVYSKMVNVPVQYLIEKLDQVSGDLVTLDRYIETKDQRLLWSV
jgi:hypothetical protein